MTEQPIEGPVSGTVTIKWFALPTTGEPDSPPSFDWQIENVDRLDDESLSGLLREIADRL